MRRLVRPLLIVLVVVALVAGLLAAIAYRNARADPVVRRAAIALPRWPRGAAPVRVALLSDIHLPSAAMDEPRLARIVAQVNALHPDLVLIAGDFIDGRGTDEAQTAAPGLARALARLRARYGVVAVPGNHDHWTSTRVLAAALARARVTLLANTAVVRGPLALGAIDDLDTRHADLPATLAAMRRLRGARVLLTHSPDVVPKLPADIALVLAGHTHCGQLVLPLVGPPVMPTNTGTRYLCGIVAEGARRTVVTAGLGTSNLPLRWNAPPDVWLLTLGPRG